MVRPRKLREFIGRLKDNASLIKANLTTKRTVSSIKIAILRATSHSSTAAPPEHQLDAILSLGHDVHLPLACACVEAVLDRLHNTRSPYVALKCLFILHNIITHGSFILKEQLSFYPLTGGQNSLKLTRFSNKSNLENWELSQWVRWYASVLERNLITTRILGCYLCCTSSSSKFQENRNNKIAIRPPDCDLLKEIDSLVCMVEGICAAPESLHYQRLDLVHEFMLLVSEDYRFTQHQIITRLNELGDRTARMSYDDSAELICCLKRLEDCRMRLVEMFANRKRNDEFWDLVRQTRVGLEELNEKRDRGRMVVWKGWQDETTELTRFVDQRVMGTSEVIKLSPCRSQWLTVSAAVA
ncbi:unnamed protein product [Coffea canephora]|uniref:ENTH domain-containing protein n=1 Tax=Coffea canephora TaxID=49390 RepID=A0A068TXS9_COFCA|nr:unnamed protein product [Coffea canephora]